VENLVALAIEEGRRDYQVEVPFVRRGAPRITAMLRGGAKNRPIEALRIPDQIEAASSS